MNTNRIKRLLLTLLVVPTISIAQSGSKEGKDATTHLGVERHHNFPEFSWDRIPLYMHIRKATAYTEDEIKFLSRFPLLTFEKSNGHRAHGSIEKGTLISARAVKKLNPAAKILYYRNVIVHYSGYDANKEIKQIPDALLKGKEGEVNLIRGKVPAYDLSSPKLRDWWVNHCKELTNDPAIDGLFLDGNIKAIEPNYLKREIGAEKKGAVTKGYHEMMRDTRKAIGSDKLMLANIIRARFDEAGLEYLGYFDGSYLEGFSHAVGKVSREDYMAKGIAAMQKAGKQGKMVIFTSGFKRNENNSKMSIDEGFTQLDSDENASEALTYPLAIFLICAEKYSYFRVHEGYSADKNERWMRWFDEYDRPLGEPQGVAKRNGYKYTRVFKHATVTLDLKKQTADIKWDHPSSNK